MARARVWTHSEAEPQNIVYENGLKDPCIFRHDDLDEEIDDDID
jgi:hypothetical protein